MASVLGFFVAVLGESDGNGCGRESCCTVGDVQTRNFSPGSPYVVFFDAYSERTSSCFKAALKFFLQVNDDLFTSMYICY